MLAWWHIAWGGVACDGAWDVESLGKLLGKPGDVLFGIFQRIIVLQLRNAAQAFVAFP